MKKIFYILICLITVLFSTSCSQSTFSTPTENIDYLCKNLQEGDYNQIVKCFKNDQAFNENIFNQLEVTNLFNDSISTYIKSNNSSLTYEIGEPVNDTVEVTFTYVDGSSVLEKALDLYLNDVITKLSSNTELTTDESLRIFSDYFKQVSTETQDTFVTEKVKFVLVNEDNNYLIESCDEKFYDLVMCNLLSAYTKYNESIK